VLQPPHAAHVIEVVPFPARDLRARQARDDRPDQQTGQREVEQNGRKVRRDAATCESRDIQSREIIANTRAADMDDDV